MGRRAPAQGSAAADTRHGGRSRDRRHRGRRALAAAAAPHGPGDLHARLAAVFTGRQAQVEARDRPRSWRSWTRSAGWSASWSWSARRHWRGSWRAIGTARQASYAQVRRPQCAAAAAAALARALLACARPGVAVAARWAARQAPPRRCRSAVRLACLSPSAGARCAHRSGGDPSRAGRGGARDRARRASACSTFHVAGGSRPPRPVSDTCGRSG